MSHRIGILFKPGQFVAGLIDTSRSVSRLELQQILPRIAPGGPEQRGSDSQQGNLSTLGPSENARQVQAVFPAHSSAAAYPASAWRMTPVAGSFQSTRSSRRAASGLPSATITRPACCE